MLCCLLCWQEGGRITVRKVNEGHYEMRVANTNPDDTSNYTCRAVNEAGEAAQNGTITVQCEWHMLHFLSLHSFDATVHFMLVFTV